MGSTAAHAQATVSLTLPCMHTPKSTGHQIDPEEVIVLDREERWFERGVREAIWERIEQPSLNKQGGLRFQLSNTWNQSLNDVTRRLSRHLPINTNSTSDSLQSPEEVQWDLTKVWFIIPYFKFKLKCLLLICIYTNGQFIVICKPRTLNDGGEDSLKYRNRKKHCFLAAAISLFIDKLDSLPWVIWKLFVLM